MNRVGFRLIKVKKDRLEECKKHHAAVWPEKLDALMHSPPDVRSTNEDCCP
jgi:L-rhamnose mutarotase